jgi:hypothetical protein
MYREFDVTVNLFLHSAFFLGTNTASLCATVWSVRQGWTVGLLEYHGDPR